MPVLDAELVSERLAVTTRAARTALSALEAAGIVTATGGRRNRRYTVPEMVGMLRDITPDGGLVRRRGEGTTLAGELPETPPERTACGYSGPRTKKHCWLAKGHKGQHRYPPG